MKCITMPDYLASALRMRRHELRLTELQAAERLGVRVQRLQALELGTAPLTVSEAHAVSRVYGISLTVLRGLVHFDREGIKPTGVPKS